MLDQTVTHYAPWDGSDDDRAVCGHWMTARDVHSAAPTCPTCGEAIAAEDALAAAIEATPLELDADEARTELDPVLNAGVAAMSPAGAALFDLARVLTACYRLTLDTDRRIA